MGIPGLTTYIHQRSDVCFDRYELHNTYLVIDGNAVSSHLYAKLKDSHNCFGGDYDKYAYVVANFFDELLQCKIIPLIIIDGGSEEKKLKTLKKRTIDRAKSASLINPGNSQRYNVFPLLFKEVFKYIVQQKHIKYVTSLFEADDDIASVARLLNCPVLSNDSDFYIFDVTYIPVNTLERCIRKSTGEYVKPCQIYTIDNFLRIFPDMDKNVMPMAAALLGNDYVKRSTFRDFFCTLKLSKASKRKYNDMQRRIEATFNFLQNRTLNTAIIRILSKIKKEHRQSILSIIEMIINGYLLASPTMLYPLGFDNEHINTVTRGVPNEPYKFYEMNLENIVVQEEPKKEDETDLEFNEECADDEVDEFLDESIVSKNEEYLYKLLPSWFIKEFNAGHYPSYFVDMITRQLYICPIQVECFDYICCMEISFKIIDIIFKLLTYEIDRNKKLIYFTRGKGRNIMNREITMHNPIMLPPLSQLRKMNIELRKDILDNCLKISDNFLVDFPPNWRLYIAVIKYWMDEAEEAFKTNCHVYAVLFSLLYHVIDKNIGFIRSSKNFNNKYGRDYRRLEHFNNSRNSYVPSVHINIYQANHEIKKEDCILAAPFFIENFETSETLYRNPKKFNVFIVHGFSLLQNCLRHIVHLNALLGYPYPSINISEFINSTLLYNLYSSFKSHNDVSAYIGHILRNSPSLLQLFTSIETRLKPVLSQAFNNRVNRSRRRRNRRDQASTSNNEVYNDCDDYEFEENYSDMNNRYYLLNQRR